MKQGKHFRIPENDKDLKSFWDSAEVLDDDTTPQWIAEDPDHDPKDYRYLGNSTWAHIRAKDQEEYFQEIEDLEESGIIRDNDEGDGCVTHFYIQDPKVARGIK